jgi:hypothetical protein
MGRTQNKEGTSRILTNEGVQWQLDTYVEQHAFLFYFITAGTYGGSFGDRLREKDTVPLPSSFLGICFVN